MRKFCFSIGAIAAAVTIMFVWSHTITSTQASHVSSMDLGALMASYTGPLPAEQWDAF